ncbi:MULTISPECIES: ATP-binding protein [Enterococcus]|uniref:ATP-binding protein n=1 Tax=Enterococcus TaxID=1350 RepID=UPI000BAF479E|nr:ATP-binding protein [Enterococcus thailandicus]ASZ07108.1 hypothetical protein CK496_04025 [Enterococcus thailandicus]
MNREKLIGLIETREENEWLDFKQEWHKESVDLLRDIFSFVNTTHKKNSYLIFGIADKTMEILGVNKDTSRKNTQNLIDFLASKKLSNEIPKVKVETLIIYGKEIDVLTIYDTDQVPIFLTDNYKKKGKQINSGQIFTRIGDTNTPKNKTAEDYMVEKLFKKRLHLDVTIYEKYDYLIRQINDWTYIDLEKKLLYNYDPNFYILIVEDEVGEEKIHEGDYYSWLVGSSDFSHEWRIGKYNFVEFMYGKHKIFEIGPVFNFDRDRGFFISPKHSRLASYNRELSYNYLLKDSLDWKFMELLSKSWDNVMVEPFYESYYSAKSILENVVVYEDREEKDYVESHYYNQTTLKDLELDFNEKIIPTDEEIEILNSENDEYGRLSLLQNNIAKALTKRLENIRRY